MSTALATIDTENYLALQEGGAIAEAMLENMGEGSAMSESDLTRVTIPTGGGTTWSIPNIMGDEHIDAIEGVLVYQGVRGLLWASDEPQEGALPLLVSHDLKIGKLVDRNGDTDSIDVAKIDEGIYDWSKLPQNEWGSGKNGVGKACKEQRVLYILRESDPLPLVVCIQPGSLKNWKEFIVAMTKAGIPFYRAVVRLTLSKDKSSGGQPFSKVAPQLVGILTPEQGKLIKENFTTIYKAVAETSFAG